MTTKIDKENYNTINQKNYEPIKKRIDLWIREFNAVETAEDMITIWNGIKDFLNQIAKLPNSDAKDLHLKDKLMEDITTSTGTFELKIKHASTLHPHSEPKPELKKHLPILTFNCDDGPSSSFGAQSPQDDMDTSKYFYCPEDDYKSASSFSLND